MIRFSRAFILNVARTTQSSPFTGNSSSRKVYFQLNYTAKTFTRAQPLTSEWLPSILSHPPHYTRRFRAQNEGITQGDNMAQFLSPWGFTLRNVWSFKALHPSYSTRSFWKGLSVSNWSLLPFFIRFSLSGCRAFCRSYEHTRNGVCMYIQARKPTHATFPSNPHPSSHRLVLLPV